MSAEIINLRRVKKNLARADADKKAAENRVKFGQSKSEKLITRFEKTRTAKELDGKELED